VTEGATSTAAVRGMANGLRPYAKHHAESSILPNAPADHVRWLAWAADNRKARVSRSLHSGRLVRLRVRYWWFNLQHPKLTATALPTLFSPDPHPPGTTKEPRSSYDLSVGNYVLRSTAFIRCQKQTWMKRGYGIYYCLRPNMHEFTKDGDSISCRSFFTSFFESRNQ
jgi:hypothetical protein